MIYPIKCECGFAGDAFAKLDELHDGKVMCPVCSKYAEQLPAKPDRMTRAEDVASAFGVCRQTISDVCIRTWKHLP